MEIQTAAPAAPPAAPQSYEIPSDPVHNLEWRKTGEIPAPKPKADPTPAKPASVDKTTEPSPASATGPKQEKKSEAAGRLEELLADLKTAGLTPAELKSFKREAKAAEATAPAKPPETTANPQEGAAPVKPVQKDFDTWEKYEEAKDKWVEDLTKFRATEAVQADRQARAEADSERALAAKVAEAKARYGETTEATIQAATSKLVNDDKVNGVVKAMLNDSPVLVDVMYVLGSKAEDLEAFINLAKTDPGKAIRKLALIEREVEIELAKPAKAAEPGEVATTAERGEDGKFLPKTPAKPKPAAPPPPEELSTRGSAPTDAIEAAVRTNDFSAFKAEEDRRDLSRRRGAS